MASPGHLLSRCVVLLSVMSTILCHPSLSEREMSYDGFQVLRLESNDPSVLVRAVRDLEQRAQVDVWSRRERSADVMVSPELLRHIRDTSERQGIQQSVVIDDVQQYLEKDFTERHQARQKRATRDVTNSYLSFNEITNYLNNLVQTATAADVTVSSIGRSFENRDVPVVELRERSRYRREKRAILIDAGIHAREWMAISMALNVIHKLAYNPDNDPEVTDLLEKFDWFVVPLVNPDGYVWSQATASNRLWRKTRTTAYNPRCPGVDGNRNFGYEWNPDIGGSRYTCANNYAGPSPFSEPETRNVRDWMTSQGDRAAAYLSVHAYGEWLLYPFGSDSGEYLPDKALMQSVANAFKAKLDQTGHSYTVGNSAALLYPAAGGSDDYAKGRLKVPASFTLEISPRTEAQGGFVLPETQVHRTVQDTWPGFKALAQRLSDHINTSGSGTSGTSGSGTSGTSGSGTGGTSGSGTGGTSGSGTGGTSGSGTGGTSGSGSSGTSGSGTSNSSGLVAINWYGTTLYLDPSNPAIWQWLQYYYRMRSAGRF